MDIRCEKCQTLYTLEERLIQPSGTPVRCTKCNHVFKAYPPTWHTPDPGVPWTLKKASGEVETYDSIVPLQDAIRTGRALPVDSLSRFGGPWRQIAALPDLAGFIPKPPSAPSRPPVAAGFPAAVPPEERQDTVRMKRPSLPSVPVGPLPVGPVSDRHSTDGYRLPPGIEEMARTLPGASIVKSERTTKPPPPLAAAARHTVEHVSPIPVSQPPGPASIRESFVIGDTLQVTVPAEIQQPPRSAESVVMMGTTMIHARVPAPNDAAHAPPERKDPDFSSVKPMADEKWESGAAPELREPTWTGTSTTIRTEEADEFDSPPRRGRFIAVLVVIMAVLASGTIGFWLYNRHKDSVKTQLGEVVSSKEQSRHRAFFFKGRENFLLDTEAAWMRADREFNQVLAMEPQHPQTLAALAQMNAVWAQYLRDRQIDAMIDLESGDAQAAARIEETAGKYRARVEEAVRWAEQAYKASAELPEVRLAMADVMRLRGDMEAARRHVAAVSGARDTVDFRYVSALIRLDSGEDAAKVVAELEDALPVPPALRILYRIARLQAFLKKYNDARATLDRLLTLNSGHEQSRKLIARINRNLVIALHLPSGAVEPAPAVAVDSAEASENIDTASLALSPEETTAVAAANRDSKLARAIRMQQSGRVEDAIRLYGDVLDEEPGNLDALVGMGYAQLDINATGRAVTFFRRALNNSSSFGPAIAGMGDSYRKMGQPDEALKWYNRYLESNPSGSRAVQIRRQVELLEEERKTSPGLAPAATDTASPARGGSDTGDNPYVPVKPAPESSPESASPRAVPEPAPEPAPQPVLAPEE